MTHFSTNEITVLLALLGQFRTIRAVAISARLERDGGPRFDFDLRAEMLTNQCCAVHLALRRFPWDSDDC